MKKKPSKVGYFTKSAENISTTLTAKSAKKKFKIRLSFYGTLDV